MDDPINSYWELLPETDVIFCPDANIPVAVVSFSNREVAMHIVNMHNSMLDQANMQPFYYDKLISELRKNL